jgi:carbamoyltransferase
MEFGPRALGCRSIIGDARSREMQSVMNLKIKFRESFRPFAPIVLREHVSDWFEMEDEADSPYMLLVAQVAAERRQEVNEDGHEGLDKLKLIRSEVPAITHVDSSAWVQTVDPQRHPRLHRLMTRFADRTGCPVMINTSFNVRGEPIVCTPEDAYHCFMGTDMDVLVLENHLLLKNQQPEGAVPDRDAYLAQFELD